MPKLGCVPPCAAKTSAASPALQGKTKHKKINTFGGLSQDWVGGKILFMCFLRGLSSWGRKSNKVRRDSQSLCVVSQFTYYAKSKFTTAYF